MISTRFMGANPPSRIPLRRAKEGRRRRAHRWPQAPTHAIVVKPDSPACLGCRGDAAGGGNLAIHRRQRGAPKRRLGGRRGDGRCGHRALERRSPGLSQDPQISEGRRRRKTRPTRLLRLPVAPPIRVANGVNSRWLIRNRG